MNTMVKATTAAAHASQTSPGVLVAALYAAAMKMLTVRSVSPPTWEKAESILRLTVDEAGGWTSKGVSPFARLSEFVGSGA